MTVFGVDYAWGRPDTGALQAAGVEFVVRYLSHDAGKNLSSAEARELSAAGLWIAVVWESAAGRALSGRTGGIADAREAARQAAECGQPFDRPIYFAVDWDAGVSQQPLINAYLDGAASVLGRGRVGLYAGYGPIRRAFEDGAVVYGWQTYAWSGGLWDKRAQLQQYSNGHTIDGVDCDYDRAMHDDFGQWRVGESPTRPTTPRQEDDMLYGQLNDGKDAVTPISFPTGAAGAIGFLCDNGLQGLPPAMLRVAVHDAKGWYLASVTVDSTQPKAVVSFRERATTDGVSVQREDDGQVQVAWDAS